MLIRTLGSPASSVFRKHWYLGSCLLFLCQALACCHHLLSSFLVWQCMRSCSKASSFNKGFRGTQLAGAIIIIICSCCTMGRSCLCQGKARQKWQSKINKEAWCEDYSLPAPAFLDLFPIFCALFFTLCPN